LEDVYGIYNKVTFAPVPPQHPLPQINSQIYKKKAKNLLNIIESIKSKPKLPTDQPKYQYNFQKARAHIEQLQELGQPLKFLGRHTTLTGYGVNYGKKEQLKLNNIFNQDALISKSIQMTKPQFTTPSDGRL
jgi:hypothetical protein